MSDYNIKHKRQLMRELFYKCLINIIMSKQIQTMGFIKLIFHNIIIPKKLIFQLITILKRMDLGQIQLQLHLFNYIANILLGLITFMQVKKQDYSSYTHHKDQHYLIEHEKKLKCICELCTCGKHRCPKRTRNNDFQTSYSRQFKQFANVMPIQPRPSYRYQQRHYAPELLKTNYQQNYENQTSVVKQIKPNSRLEQVGKSALAPQVPFIGVSSYKQQYQPYKMIKRSQNNQNPETDQVSPVKSVLYKKPSVKFQGISCYKSTFLPPPEPKGIRFQAPVYKKPEVAFNGVSSYKQQFKPIKFTAHKQIYQRNVYMNMSPARFQGKSAYNEQFQPYQMQTLNSHSRISNNKNLCKFDQVPVPRVNFVNNQQHVYYDLQQGKFY